MKILSGKPIREKMTEQFIRKIESFDQKLKLAIIQVGNDKPSNRYIEQKIKFGEKIGIEVELLKYDKEIPEKDVLDSIKALNEDSAVTGILVQLPLPNTLNEYKITQSINANKDVDGFVEKNIAKMYLNKPALYPGTPRGILEILKYYKIEIKGQNVVIAGASNLVGKPLAIMLINLGATVTSCNSNTKDIKDYLKTADIFISAIGKPHYFDETYFENNEKTVIIDVGINFLNEKMVGDVKSDSVFPLVKGLTPVPGGVGVLTVTMLMSNVIKAYEIQRMENESK